MRKVLLILFFGLSLFKVDAQIMRPDTSNDMYRTDSTQQTGAAKIIIDGETHYTDYKIISIKNDTTIIDTVLTVEKEYKFNFIRKDNFELMEFHNQGATFNKLGYSFKDNSIFPAMGFNAKQYNYYTLNDVYYYHVPTPTTELFYKRGIQQGQVLDALLTANTSEQFNVAVAYKGLRSLGRYINELSSHQNFRLSLNYRNKKNTYFIRGHMYSFKLYNDQNGGLTAQSVIDFEENNPDYKQRERMDVNYSDADNKLNGKRYYVDQNVVLFSNNRPPKELKTKDSPDLEDQFLKSDSLNKSKFLARKKSFKKDSTSLKPNMISDSIKGANALLETQILKTDSLDKPKLLASKKTVVKDSTTLKPTIVSDTITATNTLVIETPKDSISNNIDSLSIVPPTIKETPVLAASIDTVKKPLFNLILGNSLLYETKHYRFNQESPATSIYGSAFQSPIDDHTSYQRFNGQLFLQLNAPYVGSLKFKTNYFNYNYHYNSILYYDDYTISDKLKGTAVSVGADWKKNFGKIYLNADASTILFGDINGNTLKASIKFQQDDLFSFKGYAEFTSKSPDFSKLLYQSDYIDYNWQNDFANEEITSFGGTFNSEKWVNVDASYNVVDNYTYFNEDSKPTQADETLNYYKIKVIKEFKYRKFALANTVMYQNAISGNSFFRVPNWVTRNTLYFSTDLFKGAPLYLQTGVTFKYFSSYKMNAYNPLISEFTIQNTDDIGDFPMLDLFINLRLSRARMFFKLENFTSGFTGRDYYSAPTYPYRDMTFRIGVVWDFFI